MSNLKSELASQYGIVAGAVLETLSVSGGEENLDHHYTRHERSRSSKREDERLPWRKAKR